MNRFELLSLFPSLLYTEEEINAAFQSKGRTHDPSLIAARSALQAPVSRLAAWMENHGLATQRRATIEPDLMSLFSDISQVTSTVDTLARQKQEAQSHLSKVLIEKKLFELKASLDSLLDQVSALEERALQEFPALEETRCGARASELLSTLKFLAKWKADLNRTYGLLF